MFANRTLKNGIWFCIIFLLLACDKENEIEEVKKIKNVHLAGLMFDVDVKPTYWKNGLKTIFEISEFAYTTSLKIIDGDVYVAGIDWFSDKAFVLKNSVPYKELNSSGINNNIFIDFADKVMHAVCNKGAGDEFIYYQNSNKVADYVGQNTNLSISGNDVYICGNIYSNATQTRYPVLWKNGKTTSLLTANKEFNASATEIKIINKNVYVSGYIDYVNPLLADEAVLWINGVKTKLSSTGDGRADAITLHNNDVYVAGYSSEETGGTKRATYWKNGVQVVLYNSEWDSGLNDISISKSGQVYTVGYIKDFFNGAMWVDGVLDNVINGDSSVGAIKFIELEEN